MLIAGVSYKALHTSVAGFCISYYTPTTNCGGGGYNGFVLSRRSVGRSVCPSVGRSVRLHYRVRYINPIPIEGFSVNLAGMFTSTRGCAEPILPMCQLKVTIEGQISNNQILDIIRHWHVRSVCHILIKLFSLILAQMFTLTTGCAEPMLPFCRLKVKITLEGKK